MADRIGVIGAGMMGGAMAERLLEAGRRVGVVANRRRAPIEALVARGAVEAADIGALAAGSDVLLICVTDAPAVEAAMARALPRLAPGALVIDATTSDPAVTERLAAAAAARAVTFVDAPVTATPAQTRAGQATAMVGCAEADLPRIAAVIGAFCGTVRRFGDVGAGHTAKLLNNFVTQGTTALLVEAYGRARRAGVDWAALHAVMSAGAARSGSLEAIVAPALEGEYRRAAFAIANARKDVAYAARLAERIDGAPSALAAAVLARLEAAVAAGHGERRVGEMMDPAVAADIERAMLRARDGA